MLQYTPLTSCKGKCFNTPPSQAVRENATIHPPHKLAHLDLTETINCINWLNLDRCTTGKLAKITATVGGWIINKLLELLPTLYQARSGLLYRNFPQFLQLKANYTDVEKGTPWYFISDLILSMLNIFISDMEANCFFSHSVDIAPTIKVKSIGSECPSPLWIGIPDHWSVVLHVNIFLQIN